MVGALHVAQELRKSIQPEQVTPRCPRRPPPPANAPRMPLRLTPTYAPSPCGLFPLAPLPIRPVPACTDSAFLYTGVLAVLRRAPFFKMSRFMEGGRQVSPRRHFCIGTRATPATSAPGLGSPRPHLRRDWAHPCHICAGTGLTPATSAPGLGRSCGGSWTAVVPRELPDVHTADARQARVCDGGSSRCAALHAHRRIRTGSL